MNEYQPKRNLTARETDSLIKFNLSTNSLSCFISQRPRSSSTRRRALKSSIYPKPLIQVLEEQSIPKPSLSPYFDFSFDHKLLLTKYGSREMYVDEEPRTPTNGCKPVDLDDEDSSVSEVVSQCMRAISEETADRSMTQSIPELYPKNYQQSTTDLSKSRSKMSADEPLFSIRPFDVEEDGRTTLMLRNIPNKYTQHMILQEVEAAGLDQKYDFFYLPIDFKNDCNVGYAFINLIDVEFVPKIYQKFHGKKWPRFNSQKICQVCYARIQGTSQLLNHFRFSNTLQRDNRSRPLIFLNLALTENKNNKQANRGSKPSVSLTI